MSIKKRYIVELTKAEKDFIRFCISLRYQEHISCPYKSNDKKLMNKYNKIIDKLDNLKLKTLKL